MGSPDHGASSGPAAPRLPEEVARRVLAATTGARGSGAALILLPEALASTAASLAGALSGIGFSPRVELSPEAAFRGAASAEDAADSWVPSPAHRAQRLMVLAGARPWSTPFDDDHLIELAAMAHREALLASGRRLVFIEWPRGARRDAEVDLGPVAMAELFTRALDVDYPALRAANRALAARLVGARSLRVECPAGTRLTVSVAGRAWLLEDCLLGDAEPAVYLPGGEIYAPAVEDSAAGVVAFRHTGSPRRARFDGGRLVAVEHPDGTADEELAEELGVGFEPLCEVGFGTNPFAPPWQVGALYEKSAGTLHVAVGGNAHFGGRHASPRHMDLIVRAPRVSVDGEPLALPLPRWSEHAPTSRPGA